MSYYLPAALAAVIILYTAVRFNWRKWWYRNDVQFPAPAERRKDLYIAFYGCLGDQVVQTKGSVNLHMESQWEGVDVARKNIRECGCDVMLDVSPQLFVRTSGQFGLNPSAIDNLTQLFTDLRLDGTLGRVKALYPIDEPNNTVGNPHILSFALAALRLAASKFSELTEVKFATTYAADKDFICADQFDWIGFDDYDMKSSVLVGSKYKALVSSLKPHQRTMIIPGAAYGQDPVPFVNYAQSHPEVAVVLSFLWADREADVGAKGAKDNGMAQTYLHVGAAALAV